MFAQSKIDELVAWIDEQLDQSGGLYGVSDVMKDKINDALHDAYGSGEVDERGRVVAWLRRPEGTCDQHDLADFFAVGWHDQSDPGRLNKLANPSFVPQPEK